MKYNRLGNTGLYVSEICLGTMTFSGQGFFNGVIGQLGQKDATALIERSLQSGVNFIDTADVYSHGESEKMTGQALKELGVRRSDVVLATKCAGRTGSGPNDVASSRGHIMDAVARSLERLATDHIDLYQLHSADMVTPVEETMRALNDLVCQGMVRYIGCSNWQAWRIMKAQGIALHYGWNRLESLQAYYSIAGRDLERELVPLIEDQRVGLMVWSPLAGGFLSGKFTRDGGGPNDARRISFDFPPVNKERAWPIIDTMRHIAQHHGVSVARVALAWLLAKPFVSSVIIGAKTREQLDDNLQSTSLRLSRDDLNRLDEISALPLEYPAWMVERQNMTRIPGPK